MANITTVLTTTNLSTELRPNVGTKINLIVPYMSTPLTNILFKMNFFNMAAELKSGLKTPSDLMTIEKTDNRTFSDFEDEVLGKSSAIASGSAVGSDTASDNALVVADSTVFKAGDMIAISEVTTGTRREVAYIQSIVYSTNTLTLVRSANFGTLSSAIAATDLAYKIGFAGAEGSGIPTILSTAKTQRTNYCQNFKAAYGLTEQQMKSGTWTENQLAYQKRKAYIQLWEDIETTLWQGIPSSGTISEVTTGKTGFTTGGVLNGIRVGGGYSIDAGTDIVKSELDAMIKSSITNYGQSSKGRVLMCSADAVEDIDAIISASANGYNINVNAGDSIKAGYSVPFYKTSFTPEGGIPVVHSPIFDRAGIKGAVLLDLDTIVLKEFIPFRVDKIMEVDGTQQTREGIVGEYGLGRVMFKKNSYLRITGSTEPIS